MTLQEEMQRKADEEKRIKMEQEARNAYEKEENFKNLCIKWAATGELYCGINVNTSEEQFFIENLARKYNFVVQERYDYGPSWSCGAGVSYSYDFLKIYFSFGKYPASGYLRGNGRDWPGDTGTNEFKNAVWEAWRKSELGNPNNPIYEKIRNYINGMYILHEGSATIECAGTNFTTSECIGFAIFNDIKYVPRHGPWGQYFSLMLK